MGTDLILVPVGSAAEIERAIETVAREPNGSLLLPPDQFPSSTSRPDHRRSGPPFGACRLRIPAFC